jgi:hypothetical protein
MRGRADELYLAGLSWHDALSNRDRCQDLEERQSVDKCQDLDLA